MIRTLRDRLPREEALGLDAPLPMLLARVFLRGGRPASTPVQLDEGESLQRVREVLEAPMRWPELSAAWRRWCAPAT